LAYYQDFLRVRKLPLWDKNHSKAQAVRKLGYETNMTYATYETYIEAGDPETAANTVLCLIHQTNYLLDQQIRSLETAFVKEGGLRERMTRARLQERNKPHE
jgi:four helix bundle suffix protein